MNDVQRITKEREVALGNLREAMDRMYGWMQQFHVSEPKEDMKEEVDKWAKEYTRLSDLLDKMDYEE